MSILIDETTRLLVQGITGKEGSRAAKEMLEYGTKVVCGVTPAKGGQQIEGVPVYNDVRDALDHHPEVNATTIVVPPKFAKDAMLEAIDNKIPLIVVLTENIPIHDVMECYAKAREKNLALIGPSSIGMISPGKCKIGFIAGGKYHKSYKPGPVGIISKSGGMSSETAWVVKQAGFGQSTVIGMGGDVIAGTTFADLLPLFEQDKKTKIIVLFGEIGGEYEQEAAAWIKLARQHGEFTKPVAAFISGKFADSLPHVSIGHAGAIIEGDHARREAKVKALRDAGVMVADVHHELGEMVKKILGKEASEN